MLCAQQQVSGLIIDAATSKPLSFVNIAVVGSTYGTVSNQNGEFTINLDRNNQNGSIAFHFIGYETIKTEIHDLRDGMTIKMKEKPVKLRAITIVANPQSPEELIKKALERKTENYPQIAQKREVFRRSNNASHIHAFDISLNKSNIPEIDEKIINQMVDSIPHYSRSYEDNLYTLYTVPVDSGQVKRKIQGIKTVLLKEDDGGKLEKVEKVITELFNTKTDEKTFWKYKTGPVSLRESHVHISGSNADSVTIAFVKNDSLYLKNKAILYLLAGDLDWEWDFLQKTNRYKYLNNGIIGIAGEDAYAISFTGKAGADYQGMIYISIENNAILRIEYSIKERKKEKGINLLGISYGEVEDAGLLLYEKDTFGYFLKYSMRKNSTKYGFNRPIEIIRKQKRTLFNKKMNAVEMDFNLQGLQESSSETLVVYREGINEEEFSRIYEKGAKPERITSYSDSIWKGYSIIEPTKQMKEYKAKIKN